MLAFSWAQSDPAAAMAWTRELGGFEQRIGSGAVMDSWSRSDPQAAIAWAKENFEGEDNPYFIGIVSGMSETDMVGATELMTSMPYGGHEAGPLPFFGEILDRRRRRRDELG